MKNPHPTGADDQHICDLCGCDQDIELLDVCQDCADLGRARVVDGKVVLKP